MLIRKESVLPEKFSETWGSESVTLVGAMDPELCQLSPVVNLSRLLNDEPGGGGSNVVSFCEGVKVDDLPTLCWTGQSTF